MKINRFTVLSSAVRRRLAKKKYKIVPKQTPTPRQYFQDLHNPSPMFRGRVSHVAMRKVRYKKYTV